MNSGWMKLVQPYFILWFENKGNFINMTVTLTEQKGKICLSHKRNCTQRASQDKRNKKRRRKKWQVEYNPSPDRKSDPAYCGRIKRFQELSAHLRLEFFGKSLCRNHEESLSALLQPQIGWIEVSGPLVQRGGVQEGRGHARSPAAAASPRTFSGAGCGGGSSQTQTSRVSGDGRRWGTRRGWPRCPQRGARNRACR